MLIVLHLLVTKQFLKVSQGNDNTNSLDVASLRWWSSCSDERRNTCLYYLFIKEIYLTVAEIRRTVSMSTTRESLEANLVKWMQKSSKLRRRYQNEHFYWELNYYYTSTIPFSYYHFRRKFIYENKLNL